MNRITYTGLALAAFVFAALASCVREPVDLPIPQEGIKTLEMVMTVPGAGERQDGQTRAITITQENNIATVDVLAFRVNGSNETFDYSATGTLTSSNTAGAEVQTFTAGLRVQTYQQRFVVITNARQQVGALLARSDWKGVAKASMLAQLKVDLPSSQDRWNVTGTQNYTPIPMWGESALETVTATTTKLSATIYIMRMLARIDVKLDTTVAGLTDQFKLKSVDLYNTNPGGNLVPDATKVVEEQRNGQRYLRVNATTIPSERQPYSARSRGPIHYTDFTAPGVTDVAMTGAIYTFEAAATTTDSEATHIVIGGLYGSDTTPTYYRIDIHAAGAPATRLDMLRNNLYVVNITAVRARGHATAEEASTSTAVNMTANILVWNQPAMDNIAVDGQYHLRTNTDQITLWNNAYTALAGTGENALNVFTDVPAGWTVASITNADGTGSPTWLSLNPATGAANTTTNTYVGATANTGAARSAIITLAAGRMRLPVRVTQKAEAALALNIQNSSGQEIQDMVFSGGAGVTPVSQTFKVNWAPSNTTVGVVANQLGKYEFPNPGGNPASNDGAPYQGQTLPNNVNGTFSYTVSPPALTAAELAADPFLTKTSRFDYTVGNGVSTMTKSITLRQLNYALITEDATRNFIYPMGRASLSSGTNPGALYNYNVRSNSGWTITNVAETPRVTTANRTPMIATTTANGMSSGDNVLVNANGTANYTPGGGYKEQFTTNPGARGNSGYADITYSSNPTGRFADVTRRIFLPAAPFTVYGLCSMGYSGGGAAYNVWANQNNTQYRIQSMVQAVINYGTNLNTGTTPNTVSGGNASTVFVPQLTVLGTNYDDNRAITTQDITNATNAGADMLFISGGTTFDRATADEINKQFIQKNKPVVLMMEDSGSFVNLFVSLRDLTGNIPSNYNMYWSTSGLNGAGPVYWFYNENNSGSPQDPILYGPFGTIANLYWGCDGTGSIAYWFARNNSVDYSELIYPYADATNQTGSTDGLPTNLPSNATMSNGFTAFRFKNFPLVFAADGGFMGCYSTDSSTGAPSQVNAGTYVPIDRANYGGGSTKRTVSNSKFVANTIAWAIQRRTTQ